MDETYVPFGAEPVFVADEPIAEMTPSFGAYFEAAAGNVVRDGPLSSIYRMGELAAAQNAGGGRTESRTEARKLTAEQARAQAEAVGVTVDFGDGRYTPEAVDIMIDRARRRTVRDTIVNAYDPSWGTQLGVSALTSLADPLNVGAAFIPFVGQARYGAWLLNTTSAAGRAGVRAGVGAVEGLAGSALVEPLIAGAATQEGRDYGLSDSMYNLAFGTAFGAGLHAGGGAVKDAFSTESVKAKLDRRAAERAPVETPADIAARAPVEVNEMALRGAISDLIHGRQVQSGELIDSLIAQNPQLRDALSVTSTLRRDGPDLDDLPGRVTYWEERLNELNTKLAKPVDFLAWVRAQGGIKDADGALAQALGGDVSHLPSSVYITPKGSVRAKRGVGLDELLARAKAEGYAESIGDLTAAFQPGAKALTQNAAKAVNSRKLLAEHAERMAKESGVRKNQPIAVKARAIAGREQHILATERARVSNAVDVIMGRKQDYQTIADAPKPVEVPEYVPEPAPKPAQEVGPDGKPKPEETGAFGKPKTSEEKLTELADPTPRDAEGKAIPGSREYTERQIQKAIETSIKVNEGTALTDTILADYLPGLSKKKYDAAIKNIQKRKPNLVKKTDKASGKEVVLFGKLSKEDAEASEAARVEQRVQMVRRVMQDRFPGLKGEGPFYLNEIFGPEARVMFDMGEAWLVKYVNKGIAEGKITATVQASSPTNPTRKIGRINADHLWSSDRSADVQIKFNEPLPKERKARTKAQEAELAPPAQQIAAAPPIQARIDVPPAPLNALKAEELAGFEAQFKAIEADTLRRFEQVMTNLPPETALRIKAQLEKVNAEAADLENVYKEAATCLLNPEIA